MSAIAERRARSAAGMERLRNAGYAPVMGVDCAVLVGGGEGLDEHLSHIAGVPVHRTRHLGDSDTRTPNPLPLVPLATLVLGVHSVHRGISDLRRRNHGPTKLDKLVRGAVEMRLQRVRRVGLDAGLSEQDVAEVVEELRGTLVEKYRSALASLVPADQAPAPAPAAELDSDLDEGVEEHDERRERARIEANLVAMETYAEVGEGNLPTAAQRRAIRRYSGFGGANAFYTRGREGRFEVAPEYANRVPAAFPAHQMEGLINEYYTPTLVAREVARVLADKLPQPREPGAPLRAFEPSAGIGRMVEPWSGHDMAWTMVEYSDVSARFLRMLYPAANLTHSSFERAINANYEAWFHAFDLIVANPPYGERYAAEVEYDKAGTVGIPTTETNAAHYFSRRLFDLVATRGVLALFVPAGLLTGSGADMKALRTEMLRKTHLMAAFRLPNRAFPGADLALDLLFLEGRGGLLAEVAPEDQIVLEGRYYETAPTHILGHEMGASSPGVPKPDGGRFGYKVQGTFERLPDFTPRPVCTTCPLTAYVKTTPKKVRERQRLGDVKATVTIVDTDTMGHVVGRAVNIGERMLRFRARVESGRLAEARDQWPELRSDVDAWLRAAGAPDKHAGLKAQVAAGIAGAQAFSTFCAGGVLPEWLVEQPTVSVAGVATSAEAAARAVLEASRSSTATEHEIAAAMLAGQERDGLEASAKPIVAQGVHVALTPGMRAALHAAGWRVTLETRAGLETVLRTSEKGKTSASTTRGNQTLHAVWMRQESFLTGSMLARLEEVGELAALAGFTEVADAELTEVAALIKTPSWAEISTLSQDEINAEIPWRRFTPASPWMPTELVNEWIASRHWKSEDAPTARMQLIRDVNSFTFDVILDGRRIKYGSAAYADLTPAKDGRGTKPFVAWMNEDPGGMTFGTTGEEKAQGMTAAQKKEDFIQRATLAFRDWLDTEPAHAERVAELYAANTDPFRVGTYSRVMPFVDRWRGKITLKPHQCAGANRAVAQGGALIAFDVGVGKTYTATGIVGIARQKDGSIAPVVVVPNTIALKWKRDFERCYPDYDVAVIGAEFGKNRAGETVSRVDTMEERVAKWRGLASGMYDIALVTQSMLVRCELSVEALRAYADENEVFQRWVTIIALEDEEKGKEKALTPRQAAIAEQKIDRNVIKHLVPPDPDKKKDKDGDGGDDDDENSGVLVDEGVVFDAVGCKLLIVDEAQNYKNLYSLPQSAEAAKAKFFGNPGKLVQRAWTLDGRAFTVRRQGGSVVLLSATPAKNSPLEYFNLLQYVNADWFVERGVGSPIAFVDQFCVTARGIYGTPKGNFEQLPAITGFRNLDFLRTLIFRYGEFQTAESVNLVVPEAVKKVVEVQPTREEARLITEWRNYVRVWAGAKRGKKGEGVKWDKQPTDCDGNELPTPMEGPIPYPDQSKDFQDGAVLRGLDYMTRATLHPALADGTLVDDTANEGDDDGNKKAAKKGAKDVVDRTKRLLAEGVIEARSSKIDAVVERIVDTMERERSEGIEPGGHIVFVDSVAMHFLLATALTASGVPRARIAVLNALDAPTPADRQAVALAFNGELDDGGGWAIAPAYDVVIANKVAYEGIDLQERTVAIHHMDLPWEPASIQQRNGRAVRQKNRYPKVDVIFYITPLAGDGYRLQTIAGKAGWMSLVTSSNASAGANPAAEDERNNGAGVLALVACNEAEAAAALERMRSEKEAKQALARRKLAISRFVEWSKDPGKAASRAAFAEAEQWFPYQHLVDLVEHGAPVTQTQYFDLPLVGGAAYRVWYGGADPNDGSEHGVVTFAWVRETPNPTNFHGIIEVELDATVTTVTKATFKIAFNGLHNWLRAELAHSIQQQKEQTGRALRIAPLDILVPDPFATPRGNRMQFMSEAQARMALESDAAIVAKSGTSPYGPATWRREETRQQFLWDVVPYEDDGRLWCRLTQEYVHEAHGAKVDIMRVFGVKKFALCDKEFFENFELVTPKDWKTPTPSEFARAVADAQYGQFYKVAALLPFPRWQLREAASKAAAQSGASLREDITHAQWGDAKISASSILPDIIGWERFLALGAAAKMPYMVMKKWSEAYFWRPLPLARFNELTK